MKSDLIIRKTHATYYSTNFYSNSKCELIDSFKSEINYLCNSLLSCVKIDINDNNLAKKLSICSESKSTYRNFHSKQ